MDENLPVAIGAIVGDRYRVTGLLGRGGMGTVMAAEHRELGERVAIKFLHREYAYLDDRFFREARAAARIQTEHVARVYDVGRLPTGEPYIVMEHLKGEDLGARLQRMGPMSPTAVADVLIDVCEALAEAHGAGIVHRDLKPANVFLARSPAGDDLVKLLDFGIAKVPEGGSVTKTSAVLGSPSYMSPEQITASRDVDARSDIWSLGVVMFELLTQTLPFEGSSLVHLAIVMRDKPTPSILDLRPEVPKALDAVVARCLSKEKSGRYTNVAELAEALTPFVSPPVAHSIPRIRRILRESNTELATTIAPSEPPGGGGSSSDNRLSPRPGLSPAPSPKPAASATLDAVSSASGGTSRSFTQRRAARVLLLGVSGTMVIGAALVVGRWSGRGPEASIGSEPATATATARVEDRADAPSPTAPRTEATDPSPTASVAVVASAPPSALRAYATRPAPTTKPVAKPSAGITPPPPSRPEINCNPPYIYDENAIKRPKPGCT